MQINIDSKMETVTSHTIHRGYFPFEDPLLFHLSSDLL